MSEIEAAVQAQEAAAACVPLLDQLLRPAATAAEIADLRAAGVAEAIIAMLYPAEYRLRLPGVETLLTRTWISDWLRHLRPPAQCYLLPEKTRGRLALWDSPHHYSGILNDPLRLDMLQDLIRLAAVPGLLADSVAEAPVPPSGTPERWQTLLTAMQENSTFLAGIAFSGRHPFIYAAANSLPFKFTKRLTRDKVPIRDFYAENIFGMPD